MPRFATLAVALLALLLVPGAARAEPLRPGEVRKNIVYGNYSGLALLLDVKAPAQPNGYAILHIPGSGWQAPLGWEPSQLKDSPQLATVEAAFLEQGFTLVTINHRAAPRFRWPDPVLDAQRAARFVRAELKGWGLRDDWLGLLGASSGGHLVSMLGTLGEGSDAGLEPATPNAPKAQCIVAVMTPSDLLPLGQDGWGVALATQFVGTTAPFPEEKGFPGYQERLAPWLAASPVSYLDRKPLSRFLLVHGDADRLVPVEQSRAFATKLKAAGAQVELREMAGVGHEFPAPHAVRAAGWMRDCLNATKPAR